MVTRFMVDVKVDNYPDDTIIDYLELGKKLIVLESTDIDIGIVLLSVKVTANGKDVDDAKLSAQDIVHEALECYGKVTIENISKCYF